MENKEIDVVEMLKLMVATTPEIRKANIATLSVTLPDEVQIGVGDAGQLHAPTDTPHALLGTAALINSMIQLDLEVGHGVDLRDWMRLQMAVIQRCATVTSRGRIDRNLEQLKEQLEAQAGIDVEEAFKTGVANADSEVRLIIGKSKEWAQNVTAFDKHTPEQLAGTLNNLLAVAVKLTLHDEMMKGSGGLNLLFCLLAITARIANRGSADFTSAAAKKVTVKVPPSTRKH